DRPRRPRLYGRWAPIGFHQLMAGLVDIAALIPHAGSMVLLDTVTSWDADTIQCVARSHTDPANRLRRDNGLPASLGVEYAGQAIAVHGALRSGQKSHPGLLASVRDVMLYVPRLDKAGRRLVIDARMLAIQPSGMSYRFTVRDETRDLLEGRMTIVLT